MCPSPVFLDSIRYVVNVFVRARDKRLEAWTSKHMLHEKLVCAKFDYMYRRDARTHYHQYTMERPFLEILQNVNMLFVISRVLTNLKSLFSITIVRSTFFDDTQKQRLVETKQPSFRVTNFNSYQYGYFFAWITYAQLVLISTLKKLLVAIATKNCLKKTVGP